MTQVQENIIDCLRMFGPCEVETIVEKLKLRNIHVSVDRVSAACTGLVLSNHIKDASGFKEGYKV
jgi:hypothetical protein